MKHLNLPKKSTTSVNSNYRDKVVLGPLDRVGRLQTAHREINPLYHQLISAICSLTSVPLVLNTSFNETEPVVCRPEEALACFLRTKMDVLVLGSFFVERKNTEMEGGRSQTEDGNQRVPTPISQLPTII